ncbi:MAG: NAD(P)-dependent oxidoreductase [Helicobacteraceae bacterium]|jgi:nucleoside-diphosphate-sugar epimerase|nr:NAD(P)-dependent oxidoreductase [Helicobacteraceae bacterium]
MVLVTGANGWLGLGLVKKLTEKSEKIRALVLEGQNVEQLLAIAPDCEIVYGNVTDKSSLEKFFDGAKGAVCYHCVGVIHPRKVSEFKLINTGGTIAVWDSAESAKLKRIVIMSSNSPIGCNPHPDHLFDENSPFNPYMGYGRSKMLMEETIAKKSALSKLESVIIRAPWFYGPFQPPRQTEFFTMVRDGKAPILGKGHNRRSMSYIDNLALGMTLAGSVKKAAGKTYWIADKRPYEMNEIIDTIEEVLEKEFAIKCAHKRLRLPSFIADFARVADRALQSVGLYQQKIHVLSEMNQTIACSIEKAQKELGYEPQIDLREGMRRSIEWLMNEPKEREKLVKNKR